MNRFARIMQSISWVALLVWIATWIYGYRVAEDPRTLGWHTVGALTAAALTLLSRTWTLSYLVLTGLGSVAKFDPDSVATARRRKRRVAVVVATLSLLLIGVSFVLAGRLLWHRFSPSLHAILGAATLVLHFIALLCERRALRDETVVAVSDGRPGAVREGAQLV